MGTALAWRAPWLFPLAAAFGGALLGLVAVVSPLLAIGAAVAVAFVSLVLADLTIGVALFAFVAFLEVVPGLEGLSASKLAGALLVFSWLAAAATRPGTRAQLGALHPAVLYVGLVLLAWMAASAVWAQAPGNALSQVTRLAPNLLLVPIVFAAVRDRRDVRLLLATFVVATLVTAVYGAMNPSDADSAAAGRLSGSGVDANYLATSIVASIAVCVGAAVTRTFPPPARALALVLGLLLLGLLVATASRTGVVALVAATVCAVAVARGRRLPLLALAVVLLGLGAGYVGAVAPPDVREHLLERNSGTGREDIWKIGERMIRANPIQGVGAGNYYVVSVDYLFEPGTIRRSDLIVDTPKVAHNIYIELWAETGVVGLALFLVLALYVLGCAWRAGLRFRRLGDRELEVVSLVVLVACVSMLAAAAFNSILYQKTLWLMFAMAPALYGLARRRTAAHDR